MAHETETPSPAPRRKRVILLCSEELRPVACSVEDALRSRGWPVSVEFGVEARPWVQKTPPGSPSIRILCIPGTVDRNLAETLRAAFRPDPDADLHILGVDDSPRGLVFEIERLAGVKHASRRSLYARPRLSHPTVVETQLKNERRWLIGTTSALAAFAITLGGVAVAEYGTTPTELQPLPTTSITTPFVMPEAESEPTPSKLSEPVMSAIAPPSFDDWEELPPEEDDDEIIILDDDPAPRPTMVDVVAPPLAESNSIVGMADDAPTMEPTPEPISDDLSFDDGDSQIAAATLQLPPGFLPVAGLTVAQPSPRVGTVDPFADAPLATTPMGTVDPFADPTPDVVIPIAVDTPDTAAP